MQWLEPTNETAPDSKEPASTRRGPPQLPGLPVIPPMPVAMSEVPAPTNKTIEVEPQWLELVEERRAKNAQNANAKPTAARPVAVAAPAATKKAPSAAPNARPRVRPIIPREDE